MRLCLTTIAAVLLAGTATPADPVLDWNEIALRVLRDADVGPNEAARALAIVHLAINDAAVPITRANGPYHARLRARGPAAVEAAVAKAAHDALAALVPRRTASLTASLSASLAEIPAGPARDEGVRLGREAAGDILALRADDGSSAAAEYEGGTRIGRWRPTPPRNLAALQPHWARVKPFAVADVGHFRPLPPSAPGSVEYAAAFEEVKALGRAAGGSRTAEQTAIARLWDQPPHVPFNAIARDLARRHGLTAARSSRLFALLNVALADARVVAWDAKYRFGIWRPVTAIRLAAEDGNPATAADSAWEPLLGTPNHPDYVGGHSVAAAAASTVLRRAFGDAVAFRVESESVPGVTRSFRSLAQAAEEAGISRVYGGVGFGFSHRAGRDLGKTLGDQVASLLPPHTAAAIGPCDGSLVIVGGGPLGPEVVERFVALAGGPDARFVLIPTAAESDPIDPTRAGEAWARTFGVKHVTVLHTRDRVEADTESFVAPLKEAGGVWFSGGRQWRLVDSYLGTRTQRELNAVLERGGVIGGSSAGATIQGSYLVRGARAGNHILMAPGYEQGLGFLRGVAIDQHLIARHREGDLVGVIEAHPDLLGLGIDEPAAVVVQGDRLQVVGKGVVAVYDGKDHDGKSYYFLAAGERYDLKHRRRVPEEAGDGD